MGILKRLSKCHSYLTPFLDFGINFCSKLFYLLHLKCLRTVSINLQAILFSVAHI